MIKSYQIPWVCQADKHGLFSWLYSTPSLEDVNHNLKRSNLSTGEGTMTEQEKFQRSVEQVKRFVPDYSIKYKKDSKIQQIIGWILGKIGNKSYSSGYITTIGKTSYLPTGCDDSTTNLWTIILHEGIHAKDASKIGSVTFGAAYLLPQLLGILGAVYTLVVALGLLFGWPLELLWGSASLLLLAPLPAFGRAYAEIRGYTVSLAVNFWAGNIEDEQAYIEWLVGVFAGPGYYFMWPFKGWVRSYFEQKLQELKTCTFQLDAYLASCKVLAKSVSA